MTMPINIRHEGDTAGGNHFTPARFAVPVGIADPVERMQAVRALVREWRREPALALTDTLAGVLNRLPTSTTTALFGGMLKCADFVTSNVPGAPLPVYLAGAEVQRLYAFGPPSGAAMNVVLLSHVRHLLHRRRTPTPSRSPTRDRAARSASQARLRRGRSRSATMTGESPPSTPARRKYRSNPKARCRSRPVGRRVFLGVAGLGGLGILVGNSLRDKVNAVTDKVSSIDPTGLVGGLVPHGRWTIYTVTGGYPRRSTRRVHAATSAAWSTTR